MLVHQPLHYKEIYLTETILKHLNQGIILKGWFWWENITEDQWKIAETEKNNNM